MIFQYLLFFLVASVPVPAMLTIEYSLRQQDKRHSVKLDPGTPLGGCVLLWLLPVYALILVLEF